MSAFDRLQKEIDALTYNARSVLQALQESTVFAGSTKGFKVTRAGKEILLTRIDIYRLYKFYKEWENNGYALSDSPATSTRKEITGFNTLRIEHDKLKVKDELGNEVYPNATTHALAQHGRLLYLTNDNLSAFDDDLYWYGLIASAANPKLVTNSSPIPINLRTPIFDPNLATTKYNTHPTYLFPMGYYRLDLLGYSGDDIVHELGGKAWVISTDDYLWLESKNTWIGAVQGNARFKTKELRTNNYALAWGFDTHARGEYSTAGGIHSIASNVNSISIGNRAYASGVESIAVGGFRNHSSQQGSGILGGALNTAHGSYSGILGGRNNITGDPWYNFKLGFVSGASDCFDECIEQCGEDTTNLPGYNVLKLSVLKLSVNVGALRWSVGDTVIIYDLTTRTNGSSGNRFNTLNGDGFASFERNVTSVAADSSNPLDTTLVTVDMSIPHFFVDGGRIARLKRVDKTISQGFNSSTVGGEGLIASGYYQTVIGKYNRYRRDKEDARFIIGNGNQNTDRSNILEVYDDKFILYGTGKLDVNNNNFSGIYFDLDKTFIKYTNNNILSVQPGLINASVGSNSSYSSLILRGNGTTQALLKSSLKAGAIVADYASKVNLDELNSGYYIYSPLFNVVAQNSSILCDEVIDIEGKGGVSIRTTDATMTLKFNQLVLSGNTIGALPTAFNSRSFLDQSINGNTLTMFMDNAVPSTLTTDNTQELPPHQFLGLANGQAGRSHLINIGSQVHDGFYNTMQLAWGACTQENLNGTSATGNIGVRKGRVSESDPSITQYTPWEYLVTFSDLNKEITTFSSANSSTREIKKEDVQMYSLNGVTLSSLNTNNITFDSGCYITKIGRMVTGRIKVLCVNGYVGSSVNKLLFTLKSPDDTTEATPIGDNIAPIYAEENTYICAMGQDCIARIVNVDNSDAQLITGMQNNDLAIICERINAQFDSNSLRFEINFTYVTKG